MVVIATGVPTGPRSAMHWRTTFLRRGSLVHRRALSREGIADKGSSAAASGVAPGCLLAGEDEMLFEELHPYPSPGEALDQCAQIVQVPGQAVHAVHNDCVPVTDEPQQLGQLRPRGVPAGGLVGEHAVQGLALQLASLILVHRADPHVPMR